MNYAQLIHQHTGITQEKSPGQYADMVRLCEDVARSVDSEACRIADDAMFERLLAGCELKMGGLLRPAHRTVPESLAWLHPRGYVELSKDDQGEFVRVLRRPE